MKLLDHLEEWIITLLIGAATVMVVVAMEVTRPHCCLTCRRHLVFQSTRADRVVSHWLSAKQAARCA